MHGEHVITHRASLMSYEWPKEKFDCVVGVWSLSSVPHEQVENLLVHIDQSMKDFSFAVLIEPVLDDNEEQTERAAAGLSEQYMVSPERTYRRFFRNCQFTVHDTLKFWWSQYCPEAQRLYVLKKEF